MPSSASVDTAEQVNVEPTTTPLLGEILALLLNVGAVFPTVTVSVLVALELLESVAVAVHVILSPTSISEAVTV